MLSLHSLIIVLNLPSSQVVKIIFRSSHIFRIGSFSSQSKKETKQACFLSTIHYYKHAYMYKYHVYLHVYLVSIINQDQVSYQGPFYILSLLVFKAFFPRNCSSYAPTLYPLYIYATNQFWLLSLSGHITITHQVPSSYHERSLVVR